MFNLEKKINTEQRFANLVYKDFQTKRFGLTACCDVEIDEIKLKKYLCDYQEQKEYDETLLPTEDLDRTVLDCDDLPVKPDPTPPDNTPVIEPAICHSLHFDGVDESLKYDVPGNHLVYDFMDYNKDHSLSFWFRYVNPAPNKSPNPIYTKYDVGNQVGVIFSLLPTAGTPYIYYSLSGGAGNMLAATSTYGFIHNNWYNITFTTDGATVVDMYVNGQPVTTTIFWNSLSASAQSLATPHEIAAVTTNASGREEWGEFIMHSLRGWDVILTPAEVDLEYNFGVRLVTPVQNSNLELDIQMYNSVWNSVSSEFEVPGAVKGITFDSISMEQVDLLNICPS